VVAQLAFYGGNPRAFWSDDATTGPAQRDYLVSRVGLPTVLSASKQGGNAALRVNGAVAQEGLFSPGVTTVDGYAIGAIPLATPVNYMNGNIYAVIAIKGTISDADLLVIEQAFGRLFGVSL